MQISAEQRRQNFSIWLRTGRWPSRGDGRELKFNPWHDPSDGRFTFAGAGRLYGSGGGGQSDSRRPTATQIVYVDDPTKPAIGSLAEADAWRGEQLAKYGHKPGYREAIEARYQLYKSQFLPRPSLPAQVARSERSDNQRAQSSRDGRPPVGGGFGAGDFGGGGATGSWEVGTATGAQQKPANDSWGGGGFTGGGGGSAGGGASSSDIWPTSQPDASPGSAAQSKPDVRSHPDAGAATGQLTEQRYQVERNGYIYELDAQGRTRRVSGTLSLTDTPLRSRTNQAKAGDVDRRVSDDGGHYIAGRFNGPTDVFNHFAQDKNFNRGRYRVLEDQWAHAKRAHKEVKVMIVPHYQGGSKRPFELDVRFSIDGREHSVKMPNARKEKFHGK